MKQKKLLTLIGSLCLVLALVAIPFTACTREEPTTPEGPRPTPTPTKPITLVWASSVTANNLQGWAGTGAPWVEAVEQRTGGNVKIDVVHGGALLGWSDMIDGLGSGVADFGYACAGMDPTTFSAWLMNGLQGPIIAASSGYANVMATRVMVDEFPIMAQQLDQANLKLVFITATEPMELLLNRKVSRLADMRGVKVRTYAGEYQARLFSKIGAIPLTVAYTDAYDALQKGVIDGCLSICTGMRDQRWYEVAKYLYKCDRGICAPLSSGYFIAMNKDSWESLPKDIKQIFLEEGKRIETKYGQDVAQLKEEAVAEMVAAGVTRSDFPPEDITEWGKIEKTIWDEYIANMEPKGVPARAMINRWLELIQMPTTELQKLYDAAWEKEFAAIK